MKNTMHGIWRIYPSPLNTELISKSNFDFQVFDFEHGSYDFKSLSEDLRISKNHNVKAFARVGGLNQIEVQRCLDLGADGIVFPQLSKFEDFEKASKMMLHYPNGTRGYNPFVADFDFGDKVVPEKKECIVIVETLSAVKILERIIKIENIDTIYIGVYDLSAQLDCKGDLLNRELVYIVNQIIETTLKFEKNVSLMVNSMEDFEYFFDKGVKSFVHGVDSFHLKNAFKNILSKNEK